MPLFFEINGFTSFKKRLNLISKNWKLILLIISAIVLVWIPQFIYWKSITGQWLYDSYPGEGFYFSNPHIIGGLFSYRKGWFVYTPLMLLSIIGIPFMRKKCPDFLLPILIFIPLNIYIILSWYCWWYGGGFGLRAFIDSYALLAIPIAAALAYLLSKHILVKILIFIIIGACIFLNQFQTFQYRRGIVHWDAMTKEYYWAGFLKKNYPKNADSLIKPPDYENAREKGQEEN
jgi:hypothetical protein